VAATREPPDSGAAAGGGFPQLPNPLLQERGSTYRPHAAALAPGVVALGGPASRCGRRVGGRRTPVAAGAAPAAGCAGGGRNRPIQLTATYQPVGRVTV